MSLKKICWCLAMALIGIPNSFGFTVRGKLSPAFLSGMEASTITLEVQEYEKNFEVGKFSKLAFTSDVVDGSFEFEIQTESSYCYISFAGLRHGKKPVLKDAYLIGRWSIVDLLIDTSGLAFSGKDADLLRCQYEIYNRPLDKNGNSRQDAFGIARLSSRFETQNAEVKRILMPYRERLSAGALRIIEANGYAKIAFDFCIGAKFFAEKGEDAERVYEAVYHVKKVYVPDTTAVIAKHAFMQSRAIFQLTRLCLLVKKGMTPKDGNFTTALFETLKAEYRGELLDRVLLTCFLDYQYLLAEDMADKIMPALSNPKAVLILKRYKKATASGEEAYDFTLTGLNGRPVRLSDLKGKLLVMHFWFNGCGGCSILKGQMEPIISRFKDDSRVCFIAVNVDKSADRWEKGIDLGIYTSNHDINVFTSGMGYDHPLLKHYNFTSFPSMLLIDKSGNLISSNPPRPNDESQTRALIQLIESHL
ncbi:TlpA family protein disulfide reductase [Olivibacter jilunii]|uniref:TlpA family protein disulfide reductase n=1 Tax=Olivibacter jilunii TaxID=985016 RepID=UPI003F18AAC8